MARFCIIILFVSSGLLRAQWNLAISSQVEQDGKGLGGAKISLLQGAKVVKEIMSESNGDFTIEVPPNGDFIIQVSYPECNIKKFQVSTRGVPEDIAADNFAPTYKIGGFTMKKPLYSIDYSALKSPMVRIVFFKEQGKFDHEPQHTEVMLTALGKIRDAEIALIERQQVAVKAGDQALKKNDCVLAKTNYENAIKLIPQLPYEEYPKAQLVKCDACLKEKENEGKKAAEEAAAKAAAEKEAEAKKLAEAESKKQKEAEEKKQLAEAESRRQKEAEAKKLAEAEEKKLAESRKQETEAAAQKAAEEKKLAEAATKKQKEAEEKKQLAEAEDRKQKEAEAKKIAEAEENKLTESRKQEAETAAQKVTEDKKLAESKKQEAEAAAKKAEEDKKLTEAESKKQKEAEEKQLAESKRQKETEEKKLAEASKKTEEEREKKEKAKAKEVADRLSQKEKPKEKKKEEKPVEEKPLYVESSTTVAPKASAISPVQSTESDEKTRDIGSGKAKYSIPQVLGQDRYKSVIVRADDFFRTKRYDEAKAAYEEALSIRAKDPHATKRLALIAQMGHPKQE